MLIGLVAMVAAADAPTDFGVRTLGRPPVAAVTEPQTAVLPAPPRPAWTSGAFRISAAAQVGARFGRVTSTVRSPEHNRRVGGVPNSWHLLGRAMDIARARGVSHWQIAAALRQAGYTLIESLDEGDHSHFAFATRPGEVRPHNRTDQLAELRGEASYFRFIEAPKTRAPAPPAGPGSSVAVSFR
jgi:hypothetical protein